MRQPWAWWAAAAIVSVGLSGCGGVRTTLMGNTSTTVTGGALKVQFFRHASLDPISTAISAQLNDGTNVVLRRQFPPTNTGTSLVTDAREGFAAPGVPFSSYGSLETSNVDGGLISVFFSRLTDGNDAIIFREGDLVVKERILDNSFSPANFTPSAGAEYISIGLPKLAVLKPSSVVDHYDVVVSTVVFGLPEPFGPGVTPNLLEKIQVAIASTFDIEITRSSVSNTSEMIPGSAENFAGYLEYDVDKDAPGTNSNIVFVGVNASSLSSLFVKLGDAAVAKLVGHGDAAPSGGAFTSFSRPTIRGNTICFQATSTDGRTGLYHLPITGGLPTLIVDTTSQGGDGVNFNLFHSVHYVGESNVNTEKRFVFSARSGTAGVYSNIPDNRSLIVAGMVLNGKTVSNAVCDIDGGQLEKVVARVQFAGDADFTAVYLVEVGDFTESFRTSASRFLGLQND